jgi:hypothetical protein
VPGARRLFLRSLSFPPFCVFFCYFVSFPWIDEQRRRTGRVGRASGTGKGAHRERTGSEIHMSGKYMTGVGEGEDKQYLDTT